MMNYKKLSLTAALFASAFAAQAASPQVDFTVEAVIPDNTFYVTPVNGWDAQPLKMQWDEPSMSVTESSPGKQLRMKNTAGGIKAYLASAPVLTSAESSSAIPLQVSLAGKQLPVGQATAVELYDATAAATEQTATMAINQAGTLSKRPDAGTYMGPVTMIFDTTPATP
ncbi:TPA: fimbrial assembly protein [Enterobacter cloacae]|uniref:CS1 type fimbrial major subunit n=1 Tax=Enterobacter cloacae complex TaxID=354276 RepID=UPI00226DDCFC|nr:MULTISPECIES: CS1 type fimbrial major subunit [Enterobacter cloacae complex]HAS1114702.1 fimbrial assembly protein [Enterobacter cloacae]HCJ7367804.1 fimbrial assembly protein [Enterobacter hormaechei subsp. xiangfangensis]MCY0775177.1 CS1 type fimbrial major subunit [Enterobacter cloacae complex sp. 2022EL-00788]MDK9957131.1 fimbrial protein [Enterobacter hormaechei]MDL0040990.1 fimbrial protein [Enterobacter hormaechei]